MKQWDVLGLGCAAVDDLLYVASFPGPDTKTQVQRRERQCGGLTATALVAAARLGARCAYGGLLGDNSLSNYVAATLDAEGIDLGPVVRHAEAEPVHSTIIVDTTQHTRSILAHVGGRTGADDLLPEDAVIRAARVLFIDHYGIAGNLRAAAVARAAGISVVADFERQNVPRFAEILPWVDHLIVSVAFACQLTGAAEAGAAACRLRQYTGGTVIVTCGAAGCVYSAPEAPILQRQAAFAVSVADTTGCGDVFHGAYATALARGTDLAARIRFASAAAALKATCYGGQAGIPNQDAVEQFLINHR